MIHAYILIQTQISSASELVDDLAHVPGIVSVVGVTGPYDVIALVQVEGAHQLGELLAGTIQSHPNVARTMTCSVLPGGKLS